MGKCRWWGTGRYSSICTYSRTDQREKKRGSEEGRVAAVCIHLVKTTKKKGEEGRRRRKKRKEKKKNNVCLDWPTSLTQHKRSASARCRRGTTLRFSHTITHVFGYLTSRKWLCKTKASYVNVYVMERGQPLDGGHSRSTLSLISESTTLKP